MKRPAANPTKKTARIPQAAVVESGLEMNGGEMMKRGRLCLFVVAGAVFWGVVGTMAQADKGFALLDAKKFQEAIKELERSVSPDPQSPHSRQAEKLASELRAGSRR